MEGSFRSLITEGVIYNYDNFLITGSFLVTNAQLIGMPTYDQAPVI